jgi:2-isopropylmalate synthase
MSRIYIFDTTLRDGEQTPGVSLNSKEKLEIARSLQLLGVDIIEAGFPAASKGDHESVKLISESLKGSTIAALARTVKGDIDLAAEALKASDNPRIHTFIATSPIHMKYKLNMDEQAVLERAVEMVSYARNRCAGVEFSPEDASRSNPEFLYRILEGVIAAGAEIINIPDTVGYSTPTEIRELIRGIKENVKNIHKAVISIHCHNDLGLAVANSLAAVEGGARQIECAVNGLGERAGNAALEELVMALKTRKDYFKYETGINTKNIYRTSSLVKQLTGINVQPNKAIVGANAFAHESGIHQHGVLNHRETYEIMTPESIGLRLDSTIVLGKHSGRHAFEEKLKDLGFSALEKEKTDELFARFKELADKKKNVQDRDIEALLREETVQIAERYKLEYFYISSGNSILATSTVKIRENDMIINEAACGDGPVNATFNAIDRATGLQFELSEYQINAVTEGTDALGEVRVKIKKDDKVYTGYGISVDIIEASARAYVNALNRYHSLVNS